MKNDKHRFLNPVGIKYREVYFDELATYQPSRNVIEGFWGNICPHCLSRYSLLREDATHDGSGDVCSVRGCWKDGDDFKNEGTAYIDFKPEHIELIFVRDLTGKVTIPMSLDNYISECKEHGINVKLDNCE